MADATGLADEQLRALDRLNGVAFMRDLYLAGGTAVAFRLQHRRSLDLDLFGPDDRIDLEAIRKAMTRLFDDAQVVAMTDVTLQVRAAGTRIDVVRYPYPLLVPAEPGPARFPTAGLEDLATMKLAAIARRGIRRDFWDLHAIVTGSPVTLDNALDAYQRRHGVAEPDLYHVIRALTLFDDAEREGTPLEGMTPTLWRTIRDYFRDAAAHALRERTT